MYIYIYVILKSWIYRLYAFVQIFICLCLFVFANILLVIYDSLLVSLYV